MFEPQRLPSIRAVWSESSMGAFLDSQIYSFFMRTTKTLISLCECAGWLESSLGAYVRWYVVSYTEAHWVCGPKHTGCVVRSTLGVWSEAHWVCGPHYYVHFIPNNKGDRDVGERNFRALKFVFIKVLSCEFVCLFCSVMTFWCIRESPLGLKHYIGRNMRKRTFWLVRLTKTRVSHQNLHCPHEDTSHPRLSKMRALKILIRLCKCAGWFESSLGGHVRRYVFWRCGSYVSGNVSRLIARLVY